MRFGAFFAANPARLVLAVIVGMRFAMLAIAFAAFCCFREKFPGGFSALGTMELRHPQRSALVVSTRWRHSDMCIAKSRAAKSFALPQSICCASCFVGGL